MFWPFVPFPPLIPIPPYHLPSLLFLSFHLRPSLKAFFILTHSFLIPFLLGQSSVLSLSRCRFTLCFVRQVRPDPLYPPTLLCYVHFLFSCCLAVFFGCNCFCPENRPLQTKTPQGALTPLKRTLLLTLTFAKTLFLNLTPTSTLVLPINVDVCGVNLSQVVSFLSFCAVSRQSREGFSQ